MVGAGMVGLRRQDPLERLEDLLRAGLRLAVGRPQVPRTQVHERVGEEGAGVEIAGKAARHLPHGIGVGAIEGSPVRPRRRGMPLRQGLDGRALALGGAARQGLGPLDRLVGSPLAIGVGRAVVVRAVGERDPPGAHGARRIEARRLAEGALGLEVVEPVHQAQPLVEVGLGLRRGGRDRLVIAAEVVEEDRLVGRARMLVSLRLNGAAHQGEQQNQDRMRTSTHAALLGKLGSTTRMGVATSCRLLERLSIATPTRVRSSPKGRLDRMRPRQVIKVIALDPGAPADMPAWCRLTGHTLLHEEHPVYLIERRVEPWPTSSA